MNGCLPDINYIALTGIYRDGPLEKWWGGGVGGEFSACTNFFFAPCLCRNCFCRWNPLREFYFQTNIAFLLNSKILRHYLCFCALLNNYSPKWRWIVVDICRAAKRRSGEVNSTTFTDTEVNNCFSIYHISWITSGPNTNFICENTPKKAILFFFGCSEVKSTWLITSELTNQRARKVLFTCVVYTKNYYSMYSQQIKGYRPRFNAKSTWGGRLSGALLQSLSSGIPPPQPIKMIPFAINQNSPSVVPSTPKRQSKQEVPI